MSANTYMLKRDLPPYLWAGVYDTLVNEYGNDIDLINELRNLLTGEFTLTIKISQIKANLYVNGKPCLVRKNKFKPITIYKNVEILSGDPLSQGGSNNHPCISFENDEAIVRIKTNGFPNFDVNTYKMKIEILDLQKEKHE